ncbi:biotin-dependent carboxyltransferase family protein [Nocardia sp. CA2R105]|uniref:5-oxoprolinase subunit C family protein n=1 Tax=Nocardia coffeae TaxID=2873381 RepID=UPI001CA5F6AE|nr:biotin-dependent carboxyltransferase family protein [Nocardia coffeae]MBY8855270.1 biotin-dependent carboxyltransferase family protein [Nocardia coffeae]
MSALLESPTGPSNTAEATARLRIVDVGMYTTIQDAGRPGLAHLGIGACGPADRGAASLANRLVGNPEGAAVLENLLGGLTITATASRYVSVTGAAAEVRVDGEIVAEPQRLYLRAGQRMSVARPTWGIRVYVAVAGGVAAEQVFASCGTDSLSGLGPSPVQAGDDLQLGATVSEPPYARLELIGRALPVGVIDLGFHWGPRHYMFSVADTRALTSTVWSVGVDSNRVGVRLSGPALSIGAVDMPSEGMPLGAIQVPPSGEPIVFLADHPVTGGYPVIGVVTESDLDLLAQAPPGSRVSFSPLTGA